MSNANQNLKLRLTQALDSFFALGFAITPLLGNKAPYRDNWQHEEPLSHKTLKNAIAYGEYILDKKKNDGSKRLIYPKGLGLRTGRVSGGVVAVDLDGPSAAPLLLSLSGNRDLPPTVAFTSGREGRCQYVYTVPEQYWDGIQTKKFKTGVSGSDGIEQIELRWDGCQSVLPPSVHPMTGEYKWQEGCAPGECDIATAPLWLIELMLAPTAQPQTPTLVSQVAPRHDNHSDRWGDIDWALSYLQSLAPERSDDYDTWLAVGMALHSVDDSLLRDWDTWSQQSSKYKPGVCEAKWKSFKRTGVAIGSLAHMAKSDGWTSPFEKHLYTSHQHHRPLNSKRASVNRDSPNKSDTSNVDPAGFAATVTSVTQIVHQGLSEWEEQAKLDALQIVSGISKSSFAYLVASVRCACDEVMPSDWEQISRFIDWKNATLDFNQVLPDMASDFLHDGRILNIDPVMLWQYFLPSTLSLLGKRASLCVGSHNVPAIIWACIVGESGIGKSRAESVVLAPLKAWQAAEYHRFKPEWTKYKSSQQNKKSEAGDAAQPPLPERKFLFGVATIQAVMRRLSEQGENGSLWARDEIAGLFKSLGQFAAKGEGEGLECLLPMWDGAPAPVDRVGQDDSYLLQESRLSIAGGIQPGVFRKIFSDPDDVQGLQARFLFAAPKVIPAKRVKGYCRLADKLPAFYRWVDTQFPSGNIKLSPAADARYEAVYESIGRSASSGTTPAVRAWMRKLPSQLLRIALALHVIECYHQPNRPRHELQIDTLNRAVEFGRYYRSVFEVVQESASDSNCVSSVLVKIWDMAATSPDGLLVRDAYRQIKALPRRAKELGRSVAAYTTDLYYQLEKMGKGVVQRSGRVVRFVAGVTNPPSPQPQEGVTSAVTEVTVDEAVVPHSLEVSLIDHVSPVTKRNLEQIEQTKNITTGNRRSDSSADDISEGKPGIVGSGARGAIQVTDASINPDSTASNKAIQVPDASINCAIQIPEGNAKPLGDGETQLLSQTDLESWLARIANVGSLEDCMNCLEALDSLPYAAVEQIWNSAETLLPRFWSVAESETSSDCGSDHGGDSRHNELNDCSIREDNHSPANNLAAQTTNDELQHNPGQGFSRKVSPQQQPQPKSSDRILASPSADKPQDRTEASVKDLIAGLWVRTRDGLYGHLSAMASDGRWWVVFPRERNTSAQSRLYTAADIIPMPTS